MKRVGTFILLLLFVVISHAQTQQGYAKTLGRPNKKGKPLSGVSVRVSGGHNSVLSNTNGTFSLMMPGKRNGDAYKLQQVRKAGYELNETGIIGRTLAFSDKVPLTIVMVSSEQLQADKLRIENRAYKVAENNYKSRLATLEKKREEKHITAEQYRKELQSLQDRFEKYQALIGSLAEHYAHTDYDSLGEKDREINICIEEGRLERADSLIHTLFDPMGVLRRNKERLEVINKNIIQAKDIIRQANADMMAVLKQQAKDAEYLFQLYTISLARFDNLKAAQYIETRALLDTTNVQWQLEAGAFFLEYLADYTKAMAFLKNALHNAVRQSGEQNSNVATCYNDIGIIYSSKGDYSKALEYFQKALRIQLFIFGEQHLDVTISYNNIGGTYDSQGNYPKALEYYQKALIIQQAVFGEQHPNVALSYNNIGSVYNSQGNHPKALEYHQMALQIRQIFFGEQHPDVAFSYYNIGNVYSSQGDYLKALEYHQRALLIRQTVFGEQHPDVASSYNNIGGVYNSQGNYPKALEYYKKALLIQKAVFGEQHPNIALSYNNIGCVYSSQGNYSEALVYFQATLQIQQAIFGEQHPNVATSYNNIGSIYYSQGNYPKALEYHQRALQIQQAVFGEQHPNVATSYNNIGSVYDSQGNYPKALEYYQKALQIRQDVFGDLHPDVALSYNNIGFTYYTQKKYAKALQYYHKALEVQQIIFGKQHPDVANSYNNMGYAYGLLGNDDKALEYLQKSLTIYRSFYGNNDKRVIKTSTLIYRLYCFLLKPSPDFKQDFNDFISEYAYTITVTNKENTNKDEFYLLECNDWYMDSMESVLDEFEKPYKPKDIAVMKNDDIRKYHLNNTIGCKVGLKYVGKNEKKRIVNKYNRWKKNN